LHNLNFVITLRSLSAFAEAIAKVNIFLEPISKLNFYRDPSLRSGGQQPELALQSNADVLRNPMQRHLTPLTIVIPTKACPPLAERDHLYFRDGL